MAYTKKTFKADHDEVIGCYNRAIKRTTLQDHRREDNGMNISVQSNGPAIALVRMSDSARLWIKMKNCLGANRVSRLRRAWLHLANRKTRMFPTKPTNDVTAVKEANVTWTMNRTALVSVCGP